MRFWEHPDMQQLVELICLTCMHIRYIARKKHQPYPFVLSCGSEDGCTGAALPTQEKRDWLKSLAAQAQSAESA